MTRSLYGVPEEPAIGTPLYRDLPGEVPDLSAAVVYRGAMFRSASFVPGEDDEPVFVSCGASFGADEPSAKRVCA